MENSSAFRSESQRSKTPIPQKKIFVNPQDYEQMSSVWLAKKARLTSEQEITQILNRINLLKKEEDRTSRRIDITKGRTDSIIDKKQQQEEFQKKKLQQKLHDEEYLRYMQSKQYELRKQQQQEKQAIMSALQELKKEEHEEVKKMSRFNSERISLDRAKNKSSQQKKHDYLLQKKNFWKEKVSSFWENKIEQFQEKKSEKQYEEIRMKYRNDKIVEALEKEEMQLIKRLQFSQNVADNALKQLEDAQRLSKNEFLEKYKKQQEVLNQSQNDKFQTNDY